jgi:hypothetical protein
MSMLLEEGELALLADTGGVEALTAAARNLDLVAVLLVRAEADAAAQEQTVMAYADKRPLVWIAGDFGAAARTWARDRGPMTLLVEAEGEIPASERQRIERFVALLGRQAE